MGNLERFATFVYNITTNVGKKFNHSNIYAK